MQLFLPSLRWLVPVVICTAWYSKLATHHVHNRVGSCEPGSVTGAVGACELGVHAAAWRTARKAHASALAALQAHVLQVNIVLYDMTVSGARLRVPVDGSESDW